MKSQALIWKKKEKKPIDLVTCAGAETKLNLIASNWYWYNYSIA